MIKHWLIRDKDWNWGRPGEGKQIKTGRWVKTNDNDIIGHAKLIEMQLVVRFDRKPKFNEAKGKWLTTGFPNHERKLNGKHVGAFVGSKVDTALPANWIIYLADKKLRPKAPVGRAWQDVCNNKNDDPCFRMTFNSWGPGMDYVLLPRDQAPKKGFGLA